VSNVTGPLDELFSGLSEGLGGNLDIDEREKCEKDKFYFAREIMGNEPVFPTELTEEKAGDWKKLFEFVYAFGDTCKLGVINSPRNSLKTTLLLSRCVDLIANDRNIRILYTTNVGKNALSFSRALRHYLSHNKRLQSIYGTFEPAGAKERKDSDEEGSAWRTDYFTVSGRTRNMREPTFTAGSVGKTEVGMHYDIIICDDCVDNENTRSRDGITATIDWFRLIGSLRDKKSKYGPGGCILDQGTRYVDGDLHGFLLGEVTDDKDQQWRNYKSVVLRAIGNPECWSESEQKFIHPKLNFPFILTEELLNEERSRGSYYFSTQFQNECVSPDDAHFKPRWFQVIKPYDIPQELYYYVFTDFAFGLDDSNDRTALWAVGLDWERKAYCTDLDVGRWPLNERCERVIALVQKRNALAVSIEQISSNEGIKATLLRMRDVYRMKFRLQEIGGRSLESKKLRIVSMQPRFEQGRIFFAEQDQMETIGIRKEHICIAQNGKPMGEIINEFVRFPRATHDDIPDALSDIDKINNSTNSYFFPGPPGNFMNHPVMKGPTVINGKVQLSIFGDENGTKETKGSDDFYSRHAKRIQGSSYAPHIRKP